MAKRIHPEHPRRTRKPSAERAPSRLQTRARTAADLAEKDLMAAVLHAAAEDGGVDTYLSRIVAHLARYTRCSCVGIMFFAGDEVLACTTAHGGPAEFTRVPRSSFPASDSRICGVLTARLSRQAEVPLEGRAVLRDSRSAASAGTGIADEGMGVCVGSTFESVALIPVAGQRAVAGLIFAGDERKDRLSQRKARLLENMGIHVASIVGAVLGAQSNTPATHQDADEMELVTRLMENSNEAIVITQDWRIIYVNRKCAEGAGLSKEDMTGLAFLDITHPDDRPAVKERYSRILNGGWFPTGVVLRGLDKDGNTRWAELREIPFSWHGRPAVMSLVNDITDRKMAEEKLRESEERFRQITESMLDAISLVDAKGIVKYASPSHQRIVGYRSEDLVGRAVLDFVHPEDVESVMDSLQGILEKREARYQFRFRHADGHYVWGEASARVLLDDDGNLSGFVLASRDITERKLAEEALAQSERHYRFLADNTTDVIWVTDMSLKPSYLSPSITSLTGYSVDDAMSGNLETRLTPASARTASDAFADALAREKQKLGSTKSATVELELKCRDGSTVWVDTTVSFMRDSDGQAIGILGAMRNVTDRKKAELALRASEEKYRLLAEKTNDIIWTSDLDLRTTYVSPSVERISGFNVEERMTQNVTEQMTPESLARAAEVLREHQALEHDPQADPSRTVKIELEYYRKDGSTFWLENHVSGIRDANGTLIGFHGVAREVTERRKIEQALRASEERYRLLVETANEAIAVIQDGFLRFVSPKIKDISGYGVAEISSRPFVEFIHPDDRQMVADHYTRRLQGKQSPQTYQFRFVNKSGNTRWAQVNAVLFDWEERPATLALISDITEQKMTEESLRQSETKYRDLFEHTLLGMEVVDGQTGRTVLANRSLARMFGFNSPADMIGTNPLDYVLPEDLEWVATQISQLMADPTWDKTAQIRARTEDGRVVWLTGMGTPIEYEGRPAMLLSLVDITAAKEAEAKLHESEERYRLVVENANEAIVVLQDGLVKFANPKGAQLVGQSARELTPTPFLDFVHPDDRRMMIDNHVKRLAGEDVPNNYTFRIIDQEGNAKWIQINAVLLTWEGKPAVLSMLNDITESKKADEALRASEERFRTLIEKATDAIAILDGTGRLIYESRSMERITGYSLDDWVGKPMGDWLLHPDDIPTIAASLERLLEDPGRSSEEIRVRFRHHDGSWHYLEGTARNLLRDPSVAGIVVNYRDVTERVRAEAALQASELRYRLLAENASDVIFTSDLDMKLTYVSPSIANLTGYSTEETMSSDIYGWVAPASRDSVSKSFAWALEKARSGVELPQTMCTATLEMIKKDGGRVWVEIRIDFLRDTDGQPMGILGVARDTTDRRIAEMELERRSQLEMMITEISTAFIGISTEYIDQGIQNALESISRFTEVDRSYIFVFNGDGTRMQMAHEWCSKGIESLIDRLTSLQADDLPFLVDRVKAAECVHIPDLAGLPDTAEAEINLLRSQGVQSVIIVPMVQAGSAIGFLGLSLVRSKKTWDDETIMLLRLAAEMFSNALERKRMDLALMESEKRYRLLAENITDVIWTTDMRTNITYMSPSASRLVGFSTEELSRMTVMDLLTPDSYERGMATFAEEIARLGQQGNGHPDHWTLEVELRRKDGPPVWVEEKVAFLRDEKGSPIGLVGATRDISQRKAIEDALRLSEDKYRTLVEASPDGVLSIDNRGIITDCNSGLCRMLGYDRKQLCGTEAVLLGTKKDVDALEYYRDHLIRGEFLEVETEILCRDGQTLPIWAKLVRLAEPSTADIQTIIYFRDIADRRKIDEMKDEFVGLVSHELRSPLTVIIGALNTAISEGPRLSQKETRQLLEDAALEAEQLSHLVGNLLELSRAQANRLILHVEPVNLAKAVHKVIGSIERQSSKHKFTVELPKRPPQVSADQLRFERILYNLLENSVKYSPEGTEITVSAKREAGRLVVSVSDQGPGISKEDQAKLFRPFQQLGSPMLDHTKGAGLGLLVCRRLVEAHGGRIWIESEPGQGASFRFTLEPSNKNGADAG